MRNCDVRMEITRSGVRYWQVAEALGIGDSTFARRLRRELSPEEKEQIRTAINRIAQGEGEVYGSDADN